MLFRSIQRHGAPRRRALQPQESWSCGSPGGLGFWPHCPLRVGIAAFTCPTHGPIPPPTHRRPLPGPLRVGWPLQGPWLTSRAPQRPRRGHGRPSPQQQRPAQTTAGRPPEHTMATPNANQAPQGAGTSPRSPLVAMGGLWGCQKSENRPVMTFMPRLGVARIITCKTPLVSSATYLDKIGRAHV